MAALDLQLPPPPLFSQELVTNPVIPSPPPSRRAHRPLPTPPTQPPKPSTNDPPSIPYPRSIKNSFSSIASRSFGRARTLSVPLPLLTVRRIVEHPSIFTKLLSFLSWHDFHALSSVCRDFRNLVSHSYYRDVILSAFVPGYRWALFTVDTDLIKEVDINMHDLTLFIIAQDLALHKYPMHALSLLGSSSQGLDPADTDPTTIRFIALTQAHSRFILLIQSLVHSGSSPPPPEEFDGLGSWSSPHLAAEQRLSGVRELVFPAPLSYFSSSDKQVSSPASPKHSKLSSGSLSSSGSSRRQSVLVKNSGYSSASELGFLVSSQRPKRRTSIFGGGMKAPLPPPSFNPPSLKHYTSNWRRTLSIKRPGLGPSSISDDEGDNTYHLRIPHRRFASVNLSSDSSLTNPSPSSSRSTTDPPSPRLKYSALPSAPQSHHHGTSPHDLLMSTSRFRAPLLRVFVPCTQLDEFAISSCEEQLVDGGLWEYLSAGDIVCNFGYVPPPDIDDGSQSSSGHSSSPPGLDETNGGGSTHRKKWLIFNGHCLVHFIPPSPPPIPNAITLPSPFYFSHILSPTMNPKYILSLPPLPRHSPSPTSHRRSKVNFAANPQLQLTLSNVPTRVWSPNSPLGYAVVKKYVWLGRIPFAGFNALAEGGEFPGEGWKGEWMLEAEGTKEGKQSLEVAFKVGADGLGKRGLWEIVKEKSGKGRLWMRLVKSNVDPTPLHMDYDDDPHFEKTIHASRT